MEKVSIKSCQVVSGSFAIECIWRWNEKSSFADECSFKGARRILLLDEFETAIHTSAMSRTFRWILELVLN